MASLTQLEYLIAVDRLRSFGKAAKACHVSQPTLSMQLQKLEDEYGVQFFDRSKQPIIPTPEGLQFLEHAKLVLHEFAKLNHFAKTQGKEPIGELKIAVIPTLAPYLLPLFLGAFAKKYSKIILTVEEMTTEAILRSLEEDKIDAGILATPLGVKSLVEKPLYYEPFSLFVSRNHSLFQAAKVRESDLDGKEIWLLSEGHCLRNQVVKMCSVKNKPGIFPNIRFESGNLETIIQLVLQGHGYTLLPELAVRTLSSGERKQMVRSFVNPVPSREVSLVYRRTQYKHLLLSVLEKEIVSHLPSDLPRLKNRQIEVVGLSL